MEALKILKQNIDTIIGEDSLVERLKENRPLRIKFGVDPTRPDLTFGHLVVFNKLRQFQDLGHEAILIIGDYTTRVGDPSGRSETRPVLTEEEITSNAATYLDQAFLIMDPEKTTVRRNSDWFNGMDFMDCLRLSRVMTVARMLERDDFQKRYQSGNPISIVEFLYPLLQGHDSVKIEADVELGGSDQLFNLLVGRQLQKEAGQPEQICMTLPLLVGLDGTKKMSKSSGNYIAFNDPPREMFGKIMSIDDDVMWDYYRLLLLKSEEEITALKDTHPMEAKKSLARNLVAKFHGTEAGDRELEHFLQVFSNRELPDAMPEIAWSTISSGEATVTVVSAAAASGLFESKGEIRRLLSQGAFKINGQRVDDPAQVISEPSSSQPVIIQAGKRRFFRIR